MTIYVKDRETEEAANYKDHPLINSMESCENIEEIIKELDLLDEAQQTQLSAIEEKLKEHKKALKDLSKIAKTDTLEENFKAQFKLCVVAFLTSSCPEKTKTSRNIYALR